MEQVVFSLQISPEEMLRYYRGEAAFVQVVADNGQRVRFAAHHLRPFLSSQGIHGRFCLRFDDRQRLIELRRLKS